MVTWNKKHCSIASSYIFSDIAGSMNYYSWFSTIWTYFVFFKKLKGTTFFKVIERLLNWNISENFYKDIHDATFYFINLQTSGCQLDIKGTPPDMVFTYTHFSYKERFYSTQRQCCLSFPWIQLQILRRCCLSFPWIQLRILHRCYLLRITIIMRKHILQYI